MVPWKVHAEDLCQAYGVTVYGGYDSEEKYDAAFGRYGPNVLPKAQPLPFWRIFFKELREPMIVLLLLIGIFYAVVQRNAPDAVTIFVVIFITIYVEVYNEFRAKRALKNLQDSTFGITTAVKVRRFSKYSIVDAATVVPGDILILDAGCCICADGRLIQSWNLEVDESSLTGESCGVKKDSKVLLPESTSLAQRANMVFGGSMVVRGRGVAVVTATGRSSEMGKVMEMVRVSKEPKTPLQSSMRRLAFYLTGVAVLVSTLVSIIGVARGVPGGWQRSVLTGLSVGFATIPEELPMLVTGVISLGALTLSSHGIFLKRLHAAEALACVSTIVTDKTGTLTENRLELVSALVAAGPSPLPAAALWSSIAPKASPKPPALLPPSVDDDADSELGSESLVGSRVPAAPWLGVGSASVGQVMSLLEAWAFTSSVHFPSPAPPDTLSRQFHPSHNAAVDAAALARLHSAYSSDPFDAAVLRSVLASPCGYLLLGVADRRSTSSLVNEDPFDSATKLTSCTWKLVAASLDDADTVTFLRGAPENVIAASTVVRSGVDVVPLTAAARAAAVAALNDMAQGGLRTLALARARVGGELELVGVLAFTDPVRFDVKRGLAQCRAAGIRVVMVTGDHPLAAAAVARTIGLTDESSPPPASLDAPATRARQGHRQGEAVRDSKELEGIMDQIRSNSVFARATPEAKMRIVMALQRAGESVAVTGDGVNDAPALKVANVGIAMGEASPLAQEAAGMVLFDGSFSLVVRSIAEGRRLVDNLTKALQFYLACKLALCVLFLLAIIVHASYPLSPIQVIVLEVIMDLCAMTAFICEPAEDDLMTRSPFVPSSLLTRSLRWVIPGAVTLLVAVYIPYYVVGVLDLLPRELGRTTPQALCFFAWLISHVLLAFHMRTTHTPVVLSPSNTAMFIWAAAVALVLIITSLAAPLRSALQLTSLRMPMFLLLLGLSLVCTAPFELLKLARFISHRKRLLGARTYSFDAADAVHLHSLVRSRSTDLSEEQDGEHQPLLVD